MTYIEPPPTESSQPADIVKYLARYLTGGPISDARLVNYEDGRVTPTARTGKTHGGGADEVEEVKNFRRKNSRRWCLHIFRPASRRCRYMAAGVAVTAERYVAECRGTDAANKCTGQSTGIARCRVDRTTVSGVGRRTGTTGTSPPHKLARHLPARLPAVVHVSREALDDITRSFINLNATTSFVIRDRSQTAARCRTESPSIAAREFG
ncbi:MAG: transposase [Planctomycetaceae bacterium]